MIDVVRVGVTDPAVVRQLLVTLAQPAEWLHSTKRSAAFRPGYRPVPGTNSKGSLARYGNL